jgi:bifunctional aspartokinase / homoserine dehydrogenase 1
MKVLKFGGTSVGSPDRIREVVKIIRSQGERCITVVSAFQKVTDELKCISELACHRDQEFRLRLDNLEARHRDYAEQLLPPDKLPNMLEWISSVFTSTRETLEGIYLLRELSSHSLDQVMSTGELASSFLLHSLIEGSRFIDSRGIIRTDNNYGFAAVNFRVTDELIRDAVSDDWQVAIAPGFIGRNDSGETTTLGRGGSDYTAAIIAAAIDAEMLEIWTDVDGFMTADPKNVEKAYAIENLTYSEAIELSHFGAKVIYTPTLRPVYKKNIPIKVLNSFNPGSQGTIISNRASDDKKSPIKGVSSIDHIDLITLQGTGLVGVSGTSMRLFAALARQNVNIILITQGSSEYSITFAVSPSDALKSTSAIQEEFIHEIEYNREMRVVVEKNLSIIAIVGEKMKNTPGISAQLFKSLGRNGINVIATAQGSSELNISVVIKNDDLRKALNVIHDGFFLSRYKEMHLFVAGTGLVGNSFIKQVIQQQQVLLAEHNVKIHLLGITNTRKMLVDRKGLPADNCRELLSRNGEKADLGEFIKRMTEMNLRNSVFIDCTADERVAMRYGDILSKYVSVVTANKVACSSEMGYYRQLRNIATEKGVRFMYETTVGAGLPIIRTISDLVLSGDKVLRIEAVLSGTMNFICNEMGPDMPLSSAIRMAREMGYSEPDPRVDLSGTDVVRKIMILAREAGYQVERKDVTVKSILPDSCFKGDITEFFENVKQLDEEFEGRRRIIAEKNRKWRYFAMLENGKARVELLDVGPEHPSYNLEGSNNIVLITTNRYLELPLVIKGYGAGADVTAGGVFADLMRVVNL